jgi:hypothetical protein
MDDDKLKEFFEISEELQKTFEEQRLQDEISADNFWNSLSYEEKCNAFHAVVSRIFDGDVKQRGTYRYVLYDVFGFGPDMYARGMNCGFMALHNSIMDDETFNEKHKDM